MGPTGLIRKALTSGQYVAVCPNGHDLTEDQLVGPCPVCKALPVEVVSDGTTEPVLDFPEEDPDPDPELDRLIESGIPRPLTSTLLQAVRKRHRIRPRSSWTSRSISFDGINLPVPTVAHYMAARPRTNRLRDVEAFLRGIERFHMNKGMRCIAYNIIIDQKGRIFIGRGSGRLGSVGVVGGHTYGYNSRTVAICAILGANERPSDAMLEAYVVVCHRLKRRRVAARGRRHPTYGHRDLGAQGGGTTCPGPLYKHLRSIRRRVAARSS